jgi:hypothetical protein
MLSPLNTVIDKRKGTWTVIYTGLPDCTLRLRIEHATADEPGYVFCEVYEFATGRERTLAEFPFALIDGEEALEGTSECPAEHRDKCIQMAALWRRLTRLARFASAFPTGTGEAQLTEPKRQALDEVLDIAEAQGWHVTDVHEEPDDVEVTFFPWRGRHEEPDRGGQGCATH